MDREPGRRSGQAVPRSRSRQAHLAAVDTNGDRLGGETSGSAESLCLIQSGQDAELRQSAYDEALARGSCAR